VLFAYVFGSARDGLIRQGGDVDVAVWIRDEQKKLYIIPVLSELVESWSRGAPCDLVFLNTAGDQLSFEALQVRCCLSGKRQRSYMRPFIHEPAGSMRIDWHG